MGEMNYGRICRMEIQIAVAKVNRYAETESGDTVEIIERPSGGLSVVMADGQLSGMGNKSMSTFVVRKLISFLSEGVSDGAAARMTSEFLFVEKKGFVTATLNIFSVDFQTNTLLITRNNPTPVIIAYGENIRQLGDESSPIGSQKDIRPWLTELPLENGLTAIMFTDGLVLAGSRFREEMDLSSNIQCLLEDEGASPQSIADSLLQQAKRLDQNRPVDDISIVVLRVAPGLNDGVRRMDVRLPFSPE